MHTVSRGLHIYVSQHVTRHGCKPLVATQCNAWNNSSCLLSPLNAAQEKCNLLSGMKSGAEVWNFPLPKEDEKSYNKVAMLRLIEMTEAAALQIPSGDKVYRTDLDEDGQPTSARE